jgi:hypothetical protein
MGTITRFVKTIFREIDRTSKTADRECICNERESQRIQVMLEKERFSRQKEYDIELIIAPYKIVSQVEIKYKKGREIWQN